MNRALKRIMIDVKEILDDPLDKIYYKNYKKNLPNSSKLNSMLKQLSGSRHNTHVNKD